MSNNLKQFQKLIDEEWEDRVKENPIFATRTGDHRYNGLVGDFSEVGYERKLKQAHDINNQLTIINSEEFSEHDLLNYEVFSRMINNRIEELEYRKYRMPLSKVNGIHLNFPKLYLFTPLNTLQDYENYLSRLKAFPKLVNDNIEIMKKGLVEGQIPPKITLEGVSESILGQINNGIKRSPYFKPFLKIPNSIEESVVSDLINQAEDVIENSIFVSLKKLSEFLENEYSPALREDIAAVNLPNGTEYYQHCILYFTTLNKTAQEIHNIGQAEVKRIRTEMNEILKQVNFEGKIKEFIEFLRTGSQFYPENATELLEKTALVLKRIDGELPGLFKTLPRLPYGIRAIPDYAAPGNTTAYYQPGTGDGTKSGTYYVNTYDLKSRPLFEIEALSLHEAVPGHHLQIALQYELDLPNFRRFSHFTSFTEGWGLYAERLGLECGFYEDHYSNFGRLSYEMWRASRLVVDTGMHALGWSRQDAIDFMMKYTSLSLLNITNEVDRYISWPGQALAYKMGELKIRELRELAEKELGISFDIREFHDNILNNGSLPLDVLENKIHTWINTSK